MNRVQISVFFWIGLLVLVFIFLTPLAAGQEGLDLALEIISPSNGEIFYASHLGYIVAIPITGRVTVTEGSAEGSVEEVEVQLAIQSTHSAPLKMSATPDENGFFIFHLDLNPDNLP